jgi:hypothetical protein
MSAKEQAAQFEDSTLENNKWLFCRTCNLLLHHVRTLSLNHMKSMKLLQNVVKQPTKQPTNKKG